MLRKIIILTTLFMGAACATVDLNYDDSKYAFRTVGTDDEFKSFLDEIGNDQKLLIKEYKRWEGVQVSSGLGFLAAAAYGGFTSTYGDGANLKDAAFSAATLGALSSYGKPDVRRDAALQAAERLRCVRNAAYVFYKPFDTGSSLLNEAVNPDNYSGVTNLLSAQISPTLGIADDDPVSADFFMLLQAVKKGAASEQEIFEKRFIIVGTAVQQIMASWRNSSKTTVQSYEAYLNEFKKTIETKKDSEQNKKDAANAVAVLLSKGEATIALLNMVDAGDKYAKAQEQVIACAGKASE